jgi:pyrroline-5-carboxylate reductase
MRRAAPDAVGARVYKRLRHAGLRLDTRVKPAYDGWPICFSPGVVMSEWPRSLVLVGAGKMGEAMLRGWLGAGLEPDRVTILEPKPSPAIIALAAARAIALNPERKSLVAPEALMLAIKPQTLEAAAPDIAPLASAQTLVVSILAGKCIADLAARLPAARAFVRVMSNTPAAVGRGASAAAASPTVNATQRQWTESLMRAVGVFDWLDDETLIDAVTALSGSGPAYVFALVEAMAQAGEALGLPPAMAMKLARATVEGAGELLHSEPETSAGKLRENVTSPGGTTAAALAVLQAPNGLAALMTKAIAAAHKRARELAG